MCVLVYLVSVFRGFITCWLHFLSKKSDRRKNCHWGLDPAIMSVSVNRSSESILQHVLQQRKTITPIISHFNIGIKDLFECFMMVLNYRSADY